MAGIVNRSLLSDNRRGVVLQFIAYAICGGIATVVHVCVFHLAAWKLFPALEQADLAVKLLGLSIVEVDVAARSVNSMLSNSLAFFFSTGTAYILNILFVFEPGRHSRIVEITLFYLVSGVSVFMGTGLMGLLIRLFHTRTTYAFVLNIVFAVMINFIVRKLVIFKR